MDVETKDTSNATWKFDFADTVQADPQAKGGCLAVIRSYLHFASKSDPRAFCSLPELMLRTGLSKPAIRRAKALLVKLKYMEELFVTDEGAVMYRLVNSRKQMIDDHLRIAREGLAFERRDRKRRERKARGGNETIPPEIVIGERNVTPVGNETLPNTVEEYRRGSSTEREVIGRGEATSSNDNPYAAIDDDLSIPLDVPEDESEADEVLDHFGLNVHPAIRASLRQMLMAGQLTPGYLLATYGGADGPA